MREMQKFIRPSLQKRYNLYFLINYVQNGNLESKIVGSCGPGEIFGELALLYNSPRQATVVVKSPTASMYLLDRETFSNLVVQSSYTRITELEEFLKKVKAIKELDQYQRKKIAEVIKENDYLAGEFIIREGEEII